ncbi:hypothetical protein EDB85DRAFT_1891199 [Lactarius pseudohatsudake]|nr:hypothetical protein EDB85DRAFT_1891199 [Lactarius pseudohatsudake]
MSSNKVFKDPSPSTAKPPTGRPQTQASSQTSIRTVASMLSAPTSPDTTIHGTPCFLIIINANVTPYTFNSANSATQRINPRIGWRSSLEKARVPQDGTGARLGKYTYVKHASQRALSVVMRCIHDDASLVSKLITAGTVVWESPEYCPSSNVYAPVQGGPVKFAIAKMTADRGTIGESVIHKHFDSITKAAEMSAAKRLTDVIFVTIAWQAISLKVYWARHRRRGGGCIQSQTTPGQQYCLKYGSGDTREISVSKRVRGEGHQHPEDINP